MSPGPRIGVIGGGGWLGSAIASSILDAGVTSPDCLTLSYRQSRPAQRSGVHATQDNRELIARSDVIVVSVRPADWPALALSADGKLAISVMAGITLDQLSHRLGTSRVVRALPNAAAEVRKSYTPWVASAEATESDRAIVRGVFSACGLEDEVHSEAELDYLTGLSGSGPAFPALLAASMMAAAVAHGIDRALARRAVDAVLVGAGRLLEASGNDPRDTVDTFVNYRGTTAAAIETMRAAGFETAVRQGLSAAFHKSVALGQMF